MARGGGVKLATAGDTIRFAPDLGSSAPLYKQLAQHLADGTVRAYEASVLPAPLLPDPTSVEGSFYERLEALGQTPARALQHLRAMNVQARHAELLGVAPGHALLHITRVGDLDNGAPVELTHSYCRSDMYGFVSKTRRER